MVPFFKVGKVGIGVVAATELFVSRVQRSIAGEQFDPSQEIGDQPPYFFRKGADGWMLDFWTMSNVIRMNHKNYYHFKSFEHPYRFAFSDWKFDNNGFPLISR